jgi:hypothetical protein
MYKEKEQNYRLYTRSVIHVAADICFGYTYVASFRLDVGP